MWNHQPRSFVGVATGYDNQSRKSKRLGGTFGQRPNPSTLGSMGMFNSVFFIWLINGKETCYG